MSIPDDAIAADGGTQIIVLGNGDGKEISTGIDGRVALEGKNRLILENEPAWERVKPEVDSFLANDLLRNVTIPDESSQHDSTPHLKAIR